MENGDGEGGIRLGSIFDPLASHQLRGGRRGQQRGHDIYEQNDTSMGAGISPGPPRDRMHHLILRVPYWGLLVPALVLAAWSWRHWVHRRLPGRCAGCGYDLRATPDRCPECGSVVEPGTSPADLIRPGESSS